MGDRAIELLRADTKSGYKEVYAVGGKWQAKPYVAPKKQRSLGLFDSPRAAALEIILFKIGSTPLPPSPKSRKKRGEGRKPRQRRLIRSGSSPAALPAARIAPVSVLSEQLELQVDERPPEGTIVVPCVPLGAA